MGLIGLLVKTVAKGVVSEASNKIIKKTVNHLFGDEEEVSVHKTKSKPNKAQQGQVAIVSNNSTVSTTNQSEQGTSSCVGEIKVNVKEFEEAAVVNDTNNKTSILTTFNENANEQKSACQPTKKKVKNTVEKVGVYKIVKNSKGKDYMYAKELFTAHGFTNIVAIGKPDLKENRTKKLNKVYSISINGVTEFYESTKCKLDSRIVLMYHTLTTTNVKQINLTRNICNDENEYKFCPACGEKVHKDYKFCGKCGESLH